ncbi:unnamed protein product [Rotaria sp. Silwood1]|nr:unnamed protein product [Rotaria sp. Silwood1]
MLSTGGSYSFRVMTYNIRYDTVKDGKNQWSLRKNYLINLIRNRMPDLFGVQEALPNQIFDLQHALSAYRYYGVGKNDGKRWDAAGTRTCTWVKLRDRYSLQIFYHFNTHFDSTGRTSRLESARLI